MKPWKTDNMDMALTPVSDALCIVNETSEDSFLQVTRNVIQAEDDICVGGRSFGGSFCMTGSPPSLTNLLTRPAFFKLSYKPYKSKSQEIISMVGFEQDEDGSVIMNGDITMNEKRLMAASVEYKDQLQDFSIQTCCPMLQKMLGWLNINAESMNTRNKTTSHGNTWHGQGEWEE